MKKKNLIILIAFFSMSALYAQKKAYIVSNAHFDSQWNWDVQKSISEYIPKTLNQNLFLLEKYPNYIFNFEGGIKYAWMKEYFPHEYELIKKYIEEGRWHVTGSTWDANDPNIPSPESFTRNILYGQHFYRDEFGVEGTDIFLPDCFGFGWTLPTLAAHSGLIGFSTQKLQWRNKPFYGDSKIPFEIGLWEGVDGSRIMMVADAHNYTTKWADEDLSQSEYLNNILEKSPINTVYHYYGTGDTGGAPTIESVRSVEKGLKGEGDIQIISSTSDQLYKDYLPFDQHPELPVHTGELLMDVHATGCYTSQAAMKLYNRRNELLADAAERSAVVADWMGAIPYPKSNLNEAWKRFLWHQFHDDLTGTSIPRAYEFSWNDELISLNQFSNVLTSSMGAISHGLDTRVKGVPLVIYNPVAVPVTDIIEVSFNLPKSSGAVSIYNEKGKVVPSQILSNENGMVKMLVAVSAPSCGYAVYDIRTGGKSVSSSLKAEDNTIENSVYKVTLDKNGDMASILDKRNNKELVEAGKSVRLAMFTENESFIWPAWEILKEFVDKEPVSITENVKVSVLERGPVRATLCVERTFGESTFKQYIRLTEGGQDDRIDIFNEVDWQTSNALLKAEFPLTVSNPNATYDLGIGAIERGNNTETAYEVYSQYWTDLTDRNKEYGVAVLNDSKYGWDKPADNTIRLTLMHTPKTQGGYAYQDKQDLGKHIFTYSIVGHADDYVSAGIVNKAEVLNQPVKAFIAEKSKGVLGTNSFSFASVSNENVLIKAIKQAEKSDEYIVRVYETSGKSSQFATLSFFSYVLAVNEVNGVEDIIKGDVSSKGNGFSFEIAPFGIKTFKVKLLKPQDEVAIPTALPYNRQTVATVVPTVSVPVELAYNLKTSSYNSFRNDANFDGKGNSYASELFPEEVVFNGISFQLGGADEPNAIKSRGQVIDLPEGDFNRIYVLAASAKGDSRATFKVDKETYDVVVPDYSGFYGQWGHTGHTEGFIKNADVAYVGTHKHNMVQNKDLPYEFTYMYAFALDVPKNARQLTLPDNTHIAVFAVTLAKDAYNTVVTPAMDLLRVDLSAPDASTEVPGKRNLVFGKEIIGRSGEVGRRERAENAINEDITNKWCDYSISKPKFITVDLGKEETINGWSVFHAGLEGLDFITKEYSIQVKLNENDEWKTVDEVFDNTNLETDRLLQQPEKARYVRLNITKPDQSEGIVARIYDFQVY